MNTYTVTVTVSHTWSSCEEYETVVEADNENDALSMAKCEALNSDPDRYAAEHDGATIDSAEIKSCEVSMDDGGTSTLRCNQTIDLFADVSNA
jgi:hypothetical protein